MIQWPRPTPWVGTGAAAAALAVHGLFILLMLEDRESLASLPASGKLVGMWIHMPMSPVPGLVPATEPAVDRPADRATVARLPSAITLPPAPESAEGNPTVSGSAEDDPRPWIDWEMEARKLAARSGQDPKDFSRPLQAMREPCKPHQSSMWPKKPEVEDPPPTWRDAAKPPRGSVMMGGTRVGIVDFGDLAELLLGGPRGDPNEHLFDDMMAGKTPPSSVPDPNVCD